jgi:hypothetical protein
MKTTHKDYYSILGVPPSATLGEIKKAYRTLAKHYHPDLNHNPDAAERFRELTEACDTLTDPDRRRRYDRLYTTGTRTRTGTGAGNGTKSASAGSSGARYTHTGTRSQSGNGSSDPGSQAASRILKVLEETWLEIRRRHPDVPPVVIIIASGTDAKHPRWGHHARDRWPVAGQKRTEIMISGEGLRRTPVEVLGTLLHEAAHALGAARGVGDTSRQGRYHNIWFSYLARELGLEVTKDLGAGWSNTTVPGHTASAYTAQLAALADAMILWRHSDTPTGPATRRSTGFIAAICPCGRTIRAAASTLAAAPITCDACGGAFAPKAS